MASRGLVASSTSIRTTAPLFQSLETRALGLKHRIVLSPLTRCRFPDRVPTELAVEYYTQRATDGALLISEGVGVSDTAYGYPGTPGIFDPAQVEAWKPIVAAVKAKGSTFFAQIWHVGRVSHPKYQPGDQLPIGPSALEFDKDVIDPETLETVKAVVNRALTTEEVERIPAAFARAAEGAIAAGFDGVEIHGAHGYLLDEFLKGSSNVRTDKYGGSIENRARVVLETVDAVTTAVGADRTAIRLSPFSTVYGAAEPEPYPIFTRLIAELGKRGLAYLHVVEPRVDNSQDVELDPDADFTKPFRDVYGGTWLSAGGYLPGTAADAVAGGRADLIGFGRHFIANPDLVERIRLGAELHPYDRSTFYGPHPGHGPEQGYTDQPFLDPEIKAELEQKIEQT